MKLVAMPIRLLLAGLPHRLAWAALVVAALWLGFFWTTGALGPR